VPEEVEDWKAITPATLVAPIEHIRNMFDEAVWKCSQVTGKLCFADLHPDDNQGNLAPYKSALPVYRKIIGPAAAQQFDKDHEIGTPPAIFHAFLQAFAAGIRTEIHRLFNDVLQIGVAHSATLKEHPVDWAKTHLCILINGNKHVVKLWIKSVCDKQDDSKPLKTDLENENFIFWKDWRAPKLIYMRPSGNLPYDAAVAWNREDEVTTDKLLEGLSGRFILSLGFDVERLAGRAHVELAKAGRSAGSALEGDDRHFSQMAIEEGLKSVSENDRPHPKVGAIVVKGGRVLSKAHRGESPKSHAEYIALDVKLSDDLVAGATVYTTLEPCTTRMHPKIPCAQRLVDRKVARVVIGMLDPNPEIRGLGEQLLSEAGIETQLFQRDLKDQVEEMNREFIRVQKQRQPLSQLLDRRNLQERSATHSKDGTMRGQGLAQPNAVAYAFYETKGDNAKRAKVYVRHSAQVDGWFAFEGSYDDKQHGPHEHEGPIEEIAQRFVDADRSLRMKGYVRMN